MWGRGGRLGLILDFAVPPFPILPKACGDARAAFVLQFVCVKTANQLRRAIIGVTCVGSCTRDRGIFYSVNETRMEKFLRRDAESNRLETA